MAAGIICCDTSFLFSLYVTDAHTTTALATLKSLGRRLSISALKEFEFVNAVQLTAFQGLRSHANARAAIAQFTADLAANKHLVTRSNLPNVVTRAKRLSNLYTSTRGDRSFDILHVAVALCVGATEFLTFDTKQRTLAAVEGLIVLP